MATVDVTPTESAPATNAGIVLHDSDRLYEVIDGREVECTPMGVSENLVAAALQRALDRWNVNPPTGWVTREDLFELAEGLKRRPDVAFVAFDDWPHDDAPDAEAWSIPPTLAVEVVSRSNTAREIQTKIDEYFQAGVRKVWVVYPAPRTVYCYDTRTDVVVVDEEGTIDGGEALSGFQVAVSRLFETLRKPAK